MMYYIAYLTPQNIFPILSKIFSLIIWRVNMITLDVREQLYKSCRYPTFRIDMNVHHVMNTELHFGSTQTFDSLNGGCGFFAIY